MDWEKYNLVPKEYATAREIGLAAATLGALARRGLVDVKSGSPNLYRRSTNPAIEVYRLCDKYKNEYDTYFTIYKDNPSYGMYCSISNGIVVDCWGNPYDLTGVTAINFRKKKVYINKGE